MSDITDLLQKMMQGNMQMPNMPAPQIPGMNQSGQFGSQKSLFDMIKQYQNGQRAGGALPGGNSLFAPPSDPNAAVDDTGAVIPNPTPAAPAPAAPGAGKGGASASGSSAGKGGGVGGIAG